MYELPLAYKFVASMLAISNVNYYATRLQLPIHLPVQTQEINQLNVRPPSMGGVAINIQVNNYSFLFDDREIAIHNLDNNGIQSFGIPMKRTETSASGLERASVMKYVVNTNQIYGMATNWLIALNIDVAKLEEKNPPCVNKYPFFHSKRGIVPNPLLIVDWRDPKSRGFDRTEVKVEISAISGELLEFCDYSGAFNMGHRPSIKEQRTLTAISDAEFLRFSTLERSNLLFHFTGMECSNVFCPGIDEPLRRAADQQALETNGIIQRAEEHAP